MFHKGPVKVPDVGESGLGFFCPNRKGKEDQNTVVGQQVFQHPRDHEPDPHNTSCMCHGSRQTSDERRPEVRYNGGTEGIEVGRGEVCLGVMSTSEK